MKLRKSIVPLGSAEVSSARINGGAVQFFMAEGGVILRKTYDLNTRSLKADNAPVAYADAYIALSGGSVQDLGDIVYVTN